MILPDSIDSDWVLWEKLWKNITILFNFVKMIISFNFWKVWVMKNYFWVKKIIILWKFLVLPKVNTEVIIFSPSLRALNLSQPAKIVEIFNHKHLLLFCEILKVHFENVISLLTCNLLHIRRHALLKSLDFPFSDLFEVVKMSLITFWHRVAL